ncbi:hypothetical Protein psc1_05190 [Candidatus Phytoplasma solani]
MILCKNKLKPKQNKNPKKTTTKTPKERRHKIKLSKKTTNSKILICEGLFFTHIKK